MPFQTRFLSTLLFTLSIAAHADDFMDSFLGKLKSAIESKSAAKMEALYETGGASAEEMERLRQLIEMTFKYQPLTPMKSMEAVPLSDEFPTESRVNNGERIELSPPPVGMIRIEYDKAKSLKPYALKNGKPVLVSAKITKLDWKGPPDRPFVISVNCDSKTNRKVLIEGTYNASGVEMKFRRGYEFGVNGKSPSGFWSASINGQRLVSIKVTTDGEPGELKVDIKEGSKPGEVPDKLLIEQKISATEPLTYEGKKQQ